MVSEHIHAGKDTKATHIRCCYALRSYVGTVFSHDKHLPPSRPGHKSSVDGAWLPVWRGNEKRKKEEEENKNKKTKKNTQTATDAIASPHGMHLLVYNCIYRVAPRTFS